MTVRRTLLVALPLFTACLSVDVIPQEKDDPAEPDEPTPWQPGPPDRDADIDTGIDTGADVPAACTDRGTYSLGGVEYRGLAQACEGNLVCVDGECVELPECVAGEPLTQCAFTPAGIKGVINGFVVIDDYIYWIERGTLDARANPNEDGTIARSKLGEWSREVLYEGPALYDTSSRRWRDSNLTWTGQTLRWLQRHEGKDFTHYLHRFETERVHQRLPEYGWIFHENAAYRGGGTAIRRHPLDGSPLAAFKNAELVVSTEGADYGLTQGLGKYIYGYNYRNPYGSNKPIRFASEPPYVVQSTAEAPLTLTQTLFIGLLADRWLATAPPDESVTRWDWKAVAGPGWMLSSDDTYIYWARQDSQRVGSPRQFAARTRLDGSGEQEVLVEFGPYQQSRSLHHAASSRGVFWNLNDSPYEITSLQFAPFPLPATEPEAATD